MFSLHNYELERNFTLWLRGVVHFLTIGNNSGAEIHHYLCSAYGEENVMSLRNIHEWQLMFQDIHNMECEG